MPARSGSSGSTRRRLLGVAVSVLLFAGAVFVLRSELRQHSLSEILDQLRGFSPLRLFLALGATLLSFLALAGYDALSLAALAGGWRSAASPTRPSSGTRSPIPCPSR